MEMKLPLLVVAALSSAAFACGSSAGSNDPGSSPNGATSGDDGGAPATQGPQPGADAGAGDSASPPDYGAPSTTYPAFQPSFGQLQNQGGYVMKSPVIVAVTWNSDPTQASFDSFVDTVGGTAYWKAASSEYGVGAATSGATNHVHLSTDAPAKITDADIQSMVTTNAGVTSGWPAATKDTIYAFFLPPSTSLQTQTMSGSGTQDACSAGEGGYHDQVNVTGGTTSYAVVPSCTFGAGNTPAEQTTMSMSHELLEAVTDPDPQAGPGYLGFDHDHFAFNYFQELQAENGDACEFYRSSFFEDKESSPASFDAWVQRTWSNAAGIAGHDPCVPAAAGVYFNVTPLDLTDVKVTIPPQVTGLLPGLAPQTKGFRAQSGKSVTFAVGFYSDGPTSGPWTISVAPSNPLLAAHGQSLIDQYNPATITASVDKTSGQNGEKAYVTVQVTTAGTLFHGEIVTITSTLNGVSHYMPVWIAGD